MSSQLESFEIIYFLRLIFHSKIQCPPLFQNRMLLTKTNLKFDLSTSKRDITVIHESF